MVFGKFFGRGGVEAAADRGAAAFLAAAPVGFYALDAGGRFVFANPAFAAMLGRPAEEIVGGLRVIEAMRESDRQGGAVIAVKPVAG